MLLRPAEAIDFTFKMQPKQGNVEFVYGNSLNVGHHLTE